jgi:cytochrome c553
MKQNLLALLVIVALAGVGWSAYEIHGLKADIATLNDKTPSQSHAMTDVDFQFSNLWFAAHKENWPLATFYLNETRSHIAWMVRLYPVRTLSNGQKLELAPLEKSVEEKGIAGLRDAIAKQDATAFEAAYRSMVEQCYSCHEAAEKPYLRPGIPEGPSTRMINMDPKADWP